jgi:hypothetical protein
VFRSRNSVESKIVCYVIRGKNKVSCAEAKALNAIFSLVTKIALIHFETPEIVKMLRNVYKGSFEETFHRRFAVL